jgi:hypothetical protein
MISKLNTMSCRSALPIAIYLKSVACSLLSTLLLTAEHFLIGWRNCSLVNGHVACGVVVERLRRIVLQPCSLILQGVCGLPRPCLSRVRNTNILALCKGATCGAMCSIADVSSQVYLEHLLISRDIVDVNDSSSLVLDLIKVCVCYGS